MVVAGKMTDCDQTFITWKSLILLVGVVVAEHFGILVILMSKKYLNSLVGVVVAGKMNDYDQTSQTWKSSILLVGVVVAVYCGY